MEDYQLFYTGDRLFACSPILLLPPKHSDAVHQLQGSLALQGKHAGQASHRKAVDNASQRQSGRPAYPALQQLGAGLGSGLPDLTAALDHCIDAKTSVLLDRASTRLAQLRQQRKENKRLLQEEMEGWAQRLHQQGVSESRQVNALL